MNSVLLRQLKRMGLSLDKPPKSSKDWAQLLDRISAYYEDSDRNRYLLERSLAISGQEMAEAMSRRQEVSKARIERSESHYRNLFYNNPIALWEIDQTGLGNWVSNLRDLGVVNLDDYLDDHPEAIKAAVMSMVVEDANDAALRLHGLKSVEQLQEGWAAHNVATDAQLSPYRPLLRAIWNGQTNATYEVQSDLLARPLYGITNWSAPRNPDGSADLSRAVVAIVDITQVKEAERRLEEVIKSKDEFLASVSHELRTPLTTIYASAESLIEQVDVIDEELRSELIQFMADESREMANMVEDLLVAARAEIGKVNIVQEALELQPLVGSVIQAARLDEAGKTLNWSSVNGAAWIDPTRFKQIVRNLLTNAVRYGGDEIRVESISLGPTTFLLLSDNGKGIPEDRREAIFEAYERAHRRSGVTASVGLGLAVSRQLARLMGGDLTYEFSDNWSTFRLEMPSVDGNVRLSMSDQDLDLRQVS
jgi:signal transduction histidine kinase